MIFVLPGYRQFPFRISLLAIVVGVVGVVLWIGICNLRLEEHLVEWLGPESGIVGSSASASAPRTTRSNNSPATPGWAYTFLAIRFLGLALIVPIIEEFFLRGFLMRYVMNPNVVGSSLRRSEPRGDPRRHACSRC